LEEIKEELQRANATIAENTSEQKRLNALVLSLTNQLNDSLQLNREQALKIANLEASSRVSKKHRFGSSSQKGITNKETLSGRYDDKDDFDGTSSSVSTSIGVESTDVSSSIKIEKKRVSHKGRTN
jgi:hypothetical protein